MKSNCGFINCNRSQSIIGSCKFCKKVYCIKHRHVETHECPEMDKCIQRAKDLNSKSLLSSKISKL